MTPGWIPRSSPDTSPDAWHTPPVIRQAIQSSPYPPTIDLFADYTNSLCHQFCSLDFPFTTDKLQHQIPFYQPPYTMLDSTWQDILPALHTTQGLWGLVPSNFFYFQPTIPHTCHFTSMVHYSHPTQLHQLGANFHSTLFFIPPSPLHCICNCSSFPSH